MKSKPIIMEHFSTVHTSFVVDFTFTNNITILMGDSGTGKTAAFSFIRECMAVNPKILCLDYYDYQKDIKEIIIQTEGKLVVMNIEAYDAESLRKLVRLLEYENRLLKDKLKKENIPYEEIEAYGKVGKCD